jgi:predicted amidohydrolase
MRLAPTLEQAREHALAMARDARAQGAELALLPEYWFLPPTDKPLPDVPERFAGVRDLLPGMAREAGLTLAANALVREEGKRWNTMFVLDPEGRVLGGQRKLHPMPTEVKWGIADGEELGVLPWHETRLGGLVCADVLHPEAARILALRGAEILLNPVMSYWKPNDTTKEARRAMFIARAYDNACFVLKTGSIAEAGRAKLVGRSIVTAPWGVVAEAKDEMGEEVVLADLDLARLREERRKSLSFPYRRPQAYAGLLEKVERAEPAAERPSLGL